jgi:hypothetical protein
VGDNWEVRTGGFLEKWLGFWLLRQNIHYTLDGIRILESGVTSWM